MPSSRTEYESMAARLQRSGQQLDETRQQLNEIREDVAKTDGLIERLEQKTAATNQQIERRLSVTLAAALMGAALGAAMQESRLVIAIIVAVIVIGATVAAAYEVFFGRRAFRREARELDLPRRQMLEVCSVAPEPAAAQHSVRVVHRDERLILEHLSYEPLGTRPAGERGTASLSDDGRWYRLTVTGSEPLDHANIAIAAAIKTDAMIEAAKLTSIASEREQDRRVAAIRDQELQEELASAEAALV